MTTFTDVFGNSTLPPAEFGYQALSISANTTLVWPYNSTGGTVVSKIIDLTATVGSLVITLPDATQVSTGEDFLIKNVGSFSVTIKDPGGNTIGTCASGTATYFYLTSNLTANGSYGVIAYGVGTSSVDAASLIGYGIIAAGTSLNQSHPVITTSAPPTITASYRAQVVNFNGGVATLALDAAATLGNNFFFLLRNSGTGTLTINPNASETIDDQPTLGIQPGESMLVFCTGLAWYSVGYGRSTIYQFSQLVLDVSAAGTFTLTAAQASNKLFTFIGSPASACTVIVPSTVAVYYIQSSISTSQTVTVKTAAGTGVGVGQSQRIIAICDSTNVVSAQSILSNTQITVIDGTVTSPAIAFASASNSGWYKYASYGWALSSNGAAFIQFDVGGSSILGGLTVNSFTSTGAASLGAGSTAVTQSAGDSTTKIATTAFVAATAFSSALPAQAGQGGKYVTTDGVNASWAAIPQALPTQTGKHAGSALITDGTSASWSDNLNFVFCCAAPLSAGYL